MRDDSVWLNIELDKESTFQEFIELQYKLKKFGLNLDYDLVIDWRIVYCEVRVWMEDYKEIVEILKESKNVKGFEVDEE